MIETVASVDLPVDEVLAIQRNHIEPETLTGDEKRICIVTGTHGDELEGQYVCYEVVRRINENKHRLKGIVDVYPALNPLGMDSMIRGIPMFDLDMNRIFPGNEDGHMAEYLAHKIVESISGADLCVDIHASNVFLQEIPQARVSEMTAKNLVPMAKWLNIDYIWVHAAATVLQSTLAHSLNSIGTPTVVVEMGVGLRTTKRYCEQLTDGLFNAMVQLGIWEGEAPKVREPIVSTDGHVGFVNAEYSGIFVPCVEHWKEIEKGQHIGDILEPIRGVAHPVYAPISGLLFTLREHPIVTSGSLIARILGGNTADA